MTATIQALINAGDLWLDRAEQVTEFDAEAQFSVAMASAYFLRAQIAQRAETAERGRGVAEQLVQAAAKRQRELGKGTT